VAKGILGFLAPTLGGAVLGPYGAGVSGAIGGLLGSYQQGVQRQQVLADLLADHRQFTLTQLSNAAQSTYSMQPLGLLNAAAPPRLTRAQVDADPWGEWLAHSRADETFPEWIEREGL